MTEELNRAVGRVEATLDSILKRIEDNQVESREGRSRIYERIEETKRDIAELKLQLSEFDKRLEKAEGSLSTYKSMMVFFKGSVAASTVIGSGVTTALGILWYFFSEKIRIMFGLK